MDSTFDSSLIDVSLSSLLTPTSELMNQDDTTPFSDFNHHMDYLPGDSSEQTNATEAGYLLKLPSTFPMTFGSQNGEASSVSPATFFAFPDTSFTQGNNISQVYNPVTVTYFYEDEGQKKKKDNSLATQGEAQKWIFFDGKGNQVGSSEPTQKFTPSKKTILDLVVSPNDSSTTTTTTSPHKPRAIKIAPFKSTLSKSNCDSTSKPSRFFVTVNPRNDFPRKLYDLATDPKFPHLTFTPKGTSLIVNEDTITPVLGTVFRSSSYSSFIRQLHLYGFTKISRQPKQVKGPENNIHLYHHPQFLRDLPKVAVNLVRGRGKSTIKLVANPAQLY